MAVLVSIDCVTFNHEDYIADALDSFVMQKTSFDFEVLVYDDASTDKTKEILKEYQEKYPNIIKPYFQKENQYSKGIRRLGWRYNFPRAQGKYLAVCEGDDYWTDPLKLQKQIDFLEHHPDYSMCCHAAETVYNDKKKLGVVKPISRSRKISTEEIIRGGGAFIATNSIVYRSDTMVKPPEFYMTAPVGDYSLQIYLAHVGNVFYINEQMSAYRKGVPGSWTSKMEKQVKDKAMIQKLREHHSNIKKLLDEYNHYTDYQYTECIDFKKKESDFKFLVKTGDKQLFKHALFNDLSTAKKIKFSAKYLLSLFPARLQKIIFAGLSKLK